MTVSSTTVKNSYSGNGSNDTFVYGFKIFADTDLEVIIRSALGVETVKTLTTHYTVTNAGSASGGNVVFTSGNIPTATETVVVRREVPQTQAIDYIANDPFPAESHEEGLDRATMTIQQLQEEVNRAIKLSATNTMTSTEFTVGATDRANKVLSFDASGELSVAQELGTFKGDSATTTTAAYNVRDIVKGTTAAQLNNIYICIKASPVGTALTNTTYWVLIVDAVSAATSATAAAASATTSGNSATASANSASASASSATTSGNSATASASSATASANSATAAAASADAFDDIYLGSKSSDPSTDNDGDALAAGMLYFNTTDDLLRVYTGSAWQNAAVDTTGFATLSGTQTLTNKTITAPKIGTSILDTNGNELALLTATSSAVNEFTIANAATNNAPRLSATGETNVDLDLLAKGTGHVTIRGNTNAGALQLNCESNTHGQTIKSQPHSASVTNTMLLPAGASSTLVSLVSTDTLTNKTLTSPKINEDVALTSTATELNKLDAVSRGSIIYGNSSAATAILTKGGAGTVLTSDGTDIAWSAAAGVADNSITLAKMAAGTDGNLISYDASGDPVAVATGNDGQVLTSTGAGSPPVFESIEAGIAWQTIVTGSTLTAVAGRGYWINTTSNACTITLPSSASNGDQIIFADYARTWGTNKITIDSNGLKYQGQADSYTVEYTTSGETVDIVYSGATQGWIPLDDNSVANAPFIPQTQQAIFAFGYSSSNVNTKNLVNSSGVTGSDVTGVGTARQGTRGVSYGGDKAIISWGGGYVTTTNLVNSSGVVAADSSGAGTGRQSPAAAQYGSGLALFAFGQISGGLTAVSNLVNSSGVISSDVTASGTTKTETAGVQYGADLAIIYSGSNGGTMYNHRNLISNVGVVAADATGAGTARRGLCGVPYGTGLGAFVWGNSDGADVPLDIMNLVSYTGVVAADSSVAAGSQRSNLGAARYGFDKGIIGYGNDPTNRSYQNLVSNTGVVAANAVNAGTARRDLASAGFSLTA